MDPKQLFICSVEISNFKSVHAALLTLSRHGRLIAIVGPNGAGKTVCLEAIAFACGAPAGHLRVNHLGDLVQGCKEPSVVIRWRSFAGKELTLATTFKKTKERVFKMNGKLATKANVYCTLLKEHLYGEISFVRQAQVANIVQNGSANNLAEVIFEVSGGAHQREAAKQATACLVWMKTQIMQIRKTAMQIQSRISDDSGALEAEEDRASAAKTRITAAQKLMVSCKNYSNSIDHHVGVQEADLEDIQRCLQTAELKLQSLKRGKAEDASVAVDAAGKLKQAQAQLAAAQAKSSACSAEADQLDHLQAEADKCVTDSSALTGALSSLEAQLGAQQALHHSIQNALFSGRKHAALAEFQKDLRTAHQDLRNLDEAQSLAQHHLASLSKALSDVKQRSEDLLNQPKPRLIRAEGKRSRLRVWPLDSIAFTDRSAQFRRICQEYPAGTVLCPIELVSFEPQFAPAIHRMLGHSLIALNDKVAAEVVNRHGITCITRSGTRHMRGALEGGWRSQAATSACQYKLSAQEADVEVAQQQARLRDCQDAEEAVMTMLVKAEAEEECLTRLQADLEKSEAAVGIQRKELQRLQQEKAAAVQRIDDLQALVADDGQSHCGITDHGKAMDIGQLQKSELLAAKRIQELTGEVAKSEAALQAAKDKQQELQLQLDSMDRDSIEASQAAAEARLTECQEAVVVCREQVETINAGQGELCSNCTTLECEMQELRSKVSGNLDQINRFKLEKREVENAAKKCQQACGSSHQSCAAEADPITCAGGIEHHRNTFEADAQAFEEAAALFQVACTAGKDVEVLPEQRQAVKERQECLAKTQEQLALLEKAAGVLEVDIEQSKELAATIAGQVYHRTAAAFRASMSKAIPQLDFDLRLNGRTVADGVDVLFRESAPTHSAGGRSARGDADGDTEPEWSSNLEELSTGQRSLCALAYLLAAAGSGIKPAMLLVDEVDAALDGVNQGRVGELLHHAATALSCQIWAVSHSVTFHECCDTFVSVAKGPEGTLVAVKGNADERNKKRKVA